MDLIAKSYRLPGEILTTALFSAGTEININPPFPLNPPTTFRRPRQHDQTTSNTQLSERIILTQLEVSSKGFLYTPSLILGTAHRVLLASPLHSTNNHLFLHPQSNNYVSNFPSCASALSFWLPPASRQSAATPSFLPSTLATRTRAMLPASACQWMAQPPPAQSST